MSPCTVSRETADRLDLFIALLLRWNRTINLVSTTSEADVVTRHISDSLQLASLLGRSLQAADVGSGAGFPGMVLAIVTNTPFVLIESDKRKAAFLREAARITDAPVRVETTRVERLRHPVAVVTARAFSDIVTTLSLASGLIDSRTYVGLLKGRNPEAEIAQARQYWSMHVDIQPSQTREGSWIVILRDINRLRATSGSRFT